MRERSDPLAYDLMEPFRVLVDRRVREWIIELGEAECLVDKKFRAHVISFLKDSVEYQGRPMETSFCVEAVVRSFRAAILRGKPSLYRPWTFTR